MLIVAGGAVGLALLAGAAPLAGQAAGSQSTPVQTGTKGAPPARPSIFVPPEPFDFGDRAGWTSLFDGTTLQGWDGNPAVWKVENGAMVAESTPARRVGTTYLIWAGGELANFELKLELKLDGDIHAGLAYRSWTDPARAATLGPPRPAVPAASATGRGGPQVHVASDPRWTLYGPGMDYDADRIMSGNVEERGTPRREIAWRGGIVRTEEGKRPRLLGTVGNADALMDVMKPGDWNQVHIIARGNQLTHIVNGQVMTILIDDDPTYYTPSGLIGWGIEPYGAGKVNVRNVWLKKWPQ
jgi:hypothetical protein